MRDILWSSRLPLPVDGAQRHGPQVRAEAGQLGDVVCHLGHTGVTQGSHRGHGEGDASSPDCVRRQRAHLPPRHAFGVDVELVHVGAEGLEVWDDKLLPEGLGEQNDVALDTPETQRREGLTWFFS